MQQFLEEAKKTSRTIANLSTKVKNQVLNEMADALMAHCDYIIDHNRKDMQQAQLDDLSSALLDRLLLTGDRVKGMADAIRQIASQTEPVGKILDGWVTEDGLNIQKVSIPIGVIGIIYESRPNVTSDTAALCFKSGNVCVLKGGKEAQYSNRAIANVLRQVLAKNKLPEQAISLLPDATREGVAELIKQDKYVDLIVPRGGEALIDTNGVVLGETGAATKTFDTRVRFKFSDLINSVDQGGYAEHLVTGDAGYQYFRLPIDVNIPEAGADADIYLESLSLQLSLDEGYSDQISGIDQQVVRDVLITIGLFDLSEDLSLYKSLGSVKMSLLTCNPGAQEFVDSALPKIALSNFRLKDMKDDNEALVELTNSVRNTPAAGSALIVWIFRDDSNTDDFFTTADRGSINFELRAKWSTRLGDYTNLATSQTMSLLS